MEEARKPRSTLKLVLIVLAVIVALWILVTFIAQQNISAVVV